MLRPEWKTQYRNLWLAVVLYLFVTLVFAACVSPSLWQSHTQHNHFAWLADAFIHGRLSLAGRPPAYAGGNDFALFENRWYVVFPPFPALILMPLVALSKDVDRFRDGIFFLFCAGLAPVGLFLALQRMRQLKLTLVSERTALLLSILFAFGTVYFFTAVQGTVWFAAHVVATSATTFFLAASIGASRPILAGLALSAVLGTRTNLGPVGVFFVLESIRVARQRDSSNWKRWDWRFIVNRNVPFLVICGCAMTAMLWYNRVRFHDSFEVGYRFLQIAWQGRIEKWGMFSYHYLARNLGILLTGLPFMGAPPRSALFQINGHGLAIWITTPLYLWLLWPKRQSPLHFNCYVALVLAALPSLFYQNSGWLQFGQRFSNDYSPWLFALLALGIERTGRLFQVAACWSIVVNLFGAVSFQRHDWSSYYFIDPSQKIIYEPD